MVDKKGADGLPTPDHTASGKEHFETLDGLRGSAALLVVLFHIQGITVGFAQGKLLLSHAYLAVDFFFALSGFVIGYAYDDRWSRMTIKRFFGIRLVRLHPLVVLGVLLGLLSYLFDPFAADRQNAALPLLALATAMNLLLLPTVTLPGRWTDTHPLNGPSWTLFQEYIANIAYALLLRRLSTRTLGVLAVIAGGVLLACALSIGTLDRGYAWENLWMAPVRLAFPFITGLWLYRVKDRLPRWRLGFLPLSIVLAVAFALPTWPALGGFKMNGLYEALVVLLLFPAIVVAGAHSSGGRSMMRLCKVSGDLSYPLYITHFPLMFVWTNYLMSYKAEPASALPIAVALVPVTLALAWAAFTFWDVPIRRTLTARLRR